MFRQLLMKGVGDGWFLFGNKNQRNGRKIERLGKIIEPSKVCLLNYSCKLVDGRRSIRGLLEVLNFKTSLAIFFLTWSTFHR